MRVAAVLSLCVCLLVPAAADAETGRVRRVGPWNVAATTEKGVFQYCMMARPETKTSPGFGIARGASQLTLAMFSQKWKLEKGTSYPVTLVAGSAREELQASVESATAVTVDLTGRDAFVEGLARVPALEVRAAASTLRLPLDQGAAALARLRDCLAAEAPAPSNPFASAAERPGGGQAANPFKAPAQPEATAPAAKPPAPAPAPAAAPRMSDEAYAKARADCEQDADPDRQIAGCTTVIESGRETQAVQGIAASNRGFGYYKKGDLPGSIASYTEAIRLYPEYPNPHWGCADVHMDRQAWDEAIADYTAALKLEPKDDYSLQNRGRAHLGKGAWDAALADFDAALKLKPNESGPLNYRATAYLRKGDLDRALADADDAVRIRPDYASAHATRAEILAAKGDHAGALADYEAALKLSPTLATAIEGRDKAQAALARAGGGAKGTSAEERRALAAIAVLGVAARGCGFDPVLGTTAEIPSWSGVSPEMLDTEPYAGLIRDETLRAEAGLKADKAAFCDRVWAEYGAEGTRVRALVER
ncbi:MAG: tetratricopeptide repeat protein [Microvirga sp.]